VNAVYGFLRAILGLLRTYPSSRMAVAFDAGGETERHRIYPDYKATRDAMPEDLASQFSVIQEVLNLLGVPVVALEGIEADDILATLADREAATGAEVLIVSSDKDLAQVVSERVRLLKPGGRGTGGAFNLVGPDEVTSHYGVTPSQIVDWLALVGDSSDNIPGVPGVGEKTAAKLLQEHGTLDTILDRPNAISNERIRGLIEKHAGDAALARRLVTLDREIALPSAASSCAMEGVSEEALTELLTHLGFDSILDELKLNPVAESASGDQPRGTYRTVLSREELDEVVGAVTATDIVSVDLETTGLDPMRAGIVGIALSTAPQEGVYIPVGHDALDAPVQLPLTEVLEALRPALEGETPQLMGQNLKYDLLILRRHGIHPQGIAFDSMIASHLAHPERRQHNLEQIAQDVLGYRMQSFVEVAGKDGAFASVPIDEATTYAAEDADIVTRLRQPLLDALKSAGAQRLFDEVEMPLVPVLVRMEKAGIVVDPTELERQGSALREQLRRASQDLIDIAGVDFNPSSPKQVAHVLFEVLGLPVVDRTKTGPSTSARVLAELASQHALPGKLMEYREFEKLLNTYIDRLPESIHPETLRIHTSFHQTSTATGRLSSSDPNLQNIPVRTEIGERIRRAFVAPEGHLFLAADYSQIELRLLAHFAEDEALIDAFERGEDLHRRTASEVFELPEDEVTDRHRAVAKRINFGIVYGISPFGLARQLGVGRREAKEYIDRFYGAYPGVREYMERAVKLATERGYAETLLGRRRPLPNLSSRNVAARNFDRRNAVNTPIQGSAADLIKLAMLAIDRRIEDGDLEARMILQIHDELLFEVAHDGTEEASEIVEQEMRAIASLHVPLAIHVSVGPNWSEV
jgi:DNA polymerase-1